MKKYLFIVGLLNITFLLSFGQMRKVEIVPTRIDSLKKTLSNLKGNERVDRLNDIAMECYLLTENDTTFLKDAFDYSTQALFESRAIGYKRGAGYAYANMGACECKRAENNRGTDTHFSEAELYVEQAIEIGRDLSDDRLIDNAYKILIRLQMWRVEWE